MIERLFNLLGLINYRVSLWARNLAALFLAIMVVTILLQVFCRYVLNNSLPWTEELAKYLMVWVACLVAPWVYRENLNVSIEMFVDSLPFQFYRLIQCLITVLVMIICAVFFYEGIIFWQGGTQISASSIPITLAWFYACAPLTFGLLFLVSIERLIGQVFFPQLMFNPKESEHVA